MQLIDEIRELMDELKQSGPGTQGRHKAYKAACAKLTELEAELEAVAKVRDEAIAKWKSVDDGLVRVTAELDAQRHGTTIPDAKALYYMLMGRVLEEPEECIPAPSPRELAAYGTFRAELIGYFNMAQGDGGTATFDDLPYGQAPTPPLLDIGTNAHKFQGGVDYLPYGTVPKVSTAPAPWITPNYINRPASVDPHNTNAHEERMLKWFTYDHLPPKLAAASAPWCELAVLLCHSTPPGPERTVALRKLLEGKDAAVRATLTPGA